MSDVAGRQGARFHRDAREALEETKHLCERADRLRVDVSRMVAGSMTADGRTPDQTAAAEQLVDLVAEAAGLLGQATWFWVQTLNHEFPPPPP